MRTWMVAASLALATVGPARAQPLPDPEAHIVEELVVQARERGPAWWRVSDADTTVYILALPETDIPPGLAWDPSVLDRRLKGANALIGGSVAMDASVRDAPALYRMYRRMKSKIPMEQTLPAPLAARFAAAREKAGQPAKRYAGWAPIAAGAMLMGDVERTGPPWRDAEAAVRRKANRLRLPRRNSARYDAMPYIRAAYASLTPQTQHHCLAEALTYVEDGDTQAARAARGWARGDVAEALTAPRGIDKCLLVLGGGAELWRRTVKDHAGDIEAALKAPGHAVAMVRLRQLLAQDGVIATLEARGIRVTGPREDG